MVPGPTKVKIMKRTCIICEKEFERGPHEERGPRSITCSTRCQELRNKQRTLEWYHENREKACIYSANWKDKVKKEIFELLGDKCSNPKCLVPGGCKDPRCLQIDHVNGNGKKDRIRFGATIQYYRYILKEIQRGSKDYQLLCANCNWIKRVEKKEYSQKIYGSRTY
jgi:hypothetical protein